MKNRVFRLTAFLFLLIACDSQLKKELLIEVLPPLEAKVVYYQDKSAFDTLIYLEGKEILKDSSINETYDLYNINYFILRDDQIITHNTIKKSHSWRNEFCYYSLPSLELKKIANDTTNGYHTILSKNTGIKLPIKDNEFIYSRDSIIVHATHLTDTIHEKKIHDLSLKPSSGNLITNVEKNRMVYVYQYYQVIQVMDLDAKTVKTIDYQNGDYNYDYRHLNELDSWNPNTKYYCDVYAGNDYFYLLYWGFSHKEYSVEVVKGWKWKREKDKGKYVKTNKYEQKFPNIVEQYDWNGNPQNRYVLTGNPALNQKRFAVDEERRQFYLLSSECYASFMANLLHEKSLIAYPY